MFSFLVISRFTTPHLTVEIVTTYGPICHKNVFPFSRFLTRLPGFSLKTFRGHDERFTSRPICTSRSISYLGNWEATGPRSGLDEQSKLLSSGPTPTHEILSVVTTSDTSVGFKCSDPSVKRFMYMWSVKKF